jgi:hypothetical protein
MEEQRTNFFLNNASYSGGIFVKGGGTAIAPDGNRADLYTVSASAATSYPGNGTSNSTFSIGIGSTIDYTFSGYIGPSYGTQQLEPHIVIEFSTNVSTNYSYVELQINTTNWTVRQNNLPNGLGVTQVTAPIITQAQGGMYKVTWTVRYTQDGTGRNTARGYFQIRNTALSGVYATDGTCQVQVACMQLEQGSFPTSYIPTAGASATRAAETAVISGQNFANFYNPTQGTIYAEGYTSPGFPGFAPVTTITDSSFINNYIGQYQYTGLMGATIRWGTNIQLGDPDAGTPTNTGTLFRLATTINSGNYYSVANSAVSGSVTDPRVPTSVDRIYIGSANGGWINSTLRRVIYYPEVLSTATLQVLTSSTYI